MLVEGKNGSTLYTTGGLCIGGDLAELCGAAGSGLQGTLELRNSGNAVSERGTLVGPAGVSPAAAISWSVCWDWMWPMAALSIRV